MDDESGRTHHGTRPGAANAFIKNLLGENVLVRFFGTSKRSLTVVEPAGVGARIVSD